MPATINVYYALLYKHHKADIVIIHQQLVISIWNKYALLIDCELL